MKTCYVKKLALPVMLFSFVTPVWAHTGIDITHGFMAGFVHPWQGIDHLLVIFAVGLWASVLSGKILWQLPIIFLILMAIGAGLNFAGFTLHFAELWIALSVLVFGLIISCNWRTSGFWAMGLVMMFAFCHGYVHAAEIANSADQLSYALGFFLSTAILMSLGIVVSVLGAMRAYVFRMSFGLVSSTVGVLLLAN
ncbi:MAG: HupE/UreJ family protein [Methylococcales bacterium]